MQPEDGDCMLIRFRVKNFKSIGGEVVLDMRATRQTDHRSFVVEKNGVKLLPVAALFGANASGKSNVLGALSAMCMNITMNSRLLASVQNQQSKFYVWPFAFDEKLEQEPTEFEANFVVGDREYQYGYSITPTSVYEEWLYQRKFSANDNRWKTIFEREGDKIEFNEAKKYQELNGYRHLITDDYLVLSFFSTLKQPDISIFKDVFNWFYYCLKVPAIKIPRKHNSMYLMYRELEDAKESCLEFIREFDPDIDDLIIEEDENSDGEKEYRTYTKHGNKRFRLEMESEGTQKLIWLYVSIYFALASRKILVIDELDTQLHPLILRRIVGMFNNPEINRYHSQLIFSSHNLIVLDRNELRRDEVWFVEKVDGKTQLYSMAEFQTDGKKVRDDLDYGKHYLAGRFGAVPYQDGKGGC